MHSIWLPSLCSVLIVSLVSFVGVFTLAASRATLQKWVFLLVSLAIGGLYGDAFIHIIPESMRVFANPLLPSLLILLGVFLFFTLERILHWHHYHNIHEDHPQHTDPQIKPVGIISLVSDGFHNFFDGIIIVAGYAVGMEVGLATTLAVVLHEIPQEIGDFGILMHAGFRKIQALFFNFLSATLAILGTIVALAIGEYAQEFVLFALPVVAGGFLYIAGSDLVPELHKSSSARNTWLQFLAIGVGFSLMLLMLLIE